MRRGDRPVFSLRALLGAAGTVVLAALGDACGRRAGSLVGAMLGSVIWCAGLVLLLQLMPHCPGLRDSLGIHILAIASTSAGCVWSVWRYDRQTEKPPGDPDVTLPRLLRGHRERLESLRQRYEGKVVEEPAAEVNDA